MKRSIASLLLMVALLLSGIPAASAAPGLDKKFVKAVQAALPAAKEVTEVKTIKINGVPLNYEQTLFGKAFVAQGRTFVPVRALSDALGFPVTWDETLGMAVLSRTPLGTISLSTGTSMVGVTSSNGFYAMPNPTGVPAVVLVEDRAYVQVFVLCEALGARVEWLGEKRTLLMDYSGSATGTWKVVKGLETKITLNEASLPNLFLQLDYFTTAKGNVRKNKITVTCENSTGKNTKDRMEISLEEQMFTVTGLSIQGNEVQLELLDAFLKDICEESIRTEVMSKVQNMCATVSTGISANGKTTEESRNWISANQNTFADFGVARFTWSGGCNGFTLAKA